MDARLKTDIRLDDHLFSTRFTTTRLIGILSTKESSEDIEGLTSIGASIHKSFIEIGKASGTSI